MKITANFYNQIRPFGTFDVKGEEFVVVKKEHPKELITLFNSVVTGEKILRAGKTRNFRDFISSTRKKIK